jgi:hypothetical protein
MPRICVVSSDAGRDAVDFFFCEQYWDGHVIDQCSEMYVTLPMSEENNVLRPNASTKPSHTTDPPTPDIA